DRAAVERDAVGRGGRGAAARRAVAVRGQRRHGAERAGGHGGLDPSRGGRLRGRGGDQRDHRQHDERGEDANTHPQSVPTPTLSAMGRVLLVALLALVALPAAARADPIGATFTFTPTTPLTGQKVTFTGTPTADSETVETWNWTVDGDFAGG